MIESLKKFKYCCHDVSLYEHNRNPSTLICMLSPFRMIYILIREFSSLIYCLFKSGKSNNASVYLFAGTRNQLMFANAYKKIFNNSEVLCFSGAFNLSMKGISFFMPLFLINKWLLQWLYWGVYKKSKLRRSIFCNPEKFALAQSEVNLDRLLGCKLAVVFSSYSVQSKKINTFFKSKGIDTLFIPHAQIPVKNPIIDTKYTFLTSNQPEIHNAYRNTKIIKSKVNPFLLEGIEQSAEKCTILLCINKCDEYKIVLKYFYILYKIACRHGYRLCVRFHPSMRVKYLFNFINVFGLKVRFSVGLLVDDLVSSFVVVSGLSNVIYDAKRNNIPVLIMHSFDEELRNLQEPSFFVDCKEISTIYEDVEKIILDLSILPNQDFRVNQEEIAHSSEFLGFVKNYVQ